MIGAPLIFGPCGRDAASGLDGLTAPGVPGEFACGLPLLPSGEEPGLLSAGAGLAGATPGGLLETPPGDAPPGDELPPPPPAAPPPEEPPPDDCATANAVEAAINDIAANVTKAAFRMSRPPIAKVQRRAKQLVPGRYGTQTGRGN
ncbi:MAG: hypothetical protein ABW198_01650 [Pseudorhodoplanes sp.]